MKRENRITKGGWRTKMMFKKCKWRTEKLGTEEKSGDIIEENSGELKVYHLNDI